MRTVRVKRGAAPRLVIAALVVGHLGCRRSTTAPAGEEAQGDSVTAVPSGVSPPAVASGKPEPASPPAVASGKLEPASPPPFDVDAWLAARGLTWQPDKSCWSSVPVAGAPLLNACTCNRALQMPDEPREVLVCTVGRDQPVSAAFPFIEHTVLYVAHGRGLRPVLDIRTAASIEECPPNVSGCRAEIAPVVDGDAIRFADAPRPSGVIAPTCADAIASVEGDMRKLPEAKRGPLRQVLAGYRQICGARGRYHWRKGAFRRTP
ncbi:hypothetical protein WMF45_41360 [Sorangium sp. So ce448]|uniref:hypothetical protein n=1 Tax=Sorangium sp. So ce448 TaxID=3133314 RepID=UPI003F5D76F3